MSNENKTELTIVTVTFKSKGVIDECLDSLAADGHEPGKPGCTTEIIVVDSCSGDGTADYVAEKYPNVTVVPLDENVGFARGCNTGIRMSSSPRVLLLNPDCVVGPGTIATLTAELEAHPKCAVAGPRLTDEAGNTQVSTQNFPTVKQEFARHFAPVAERIGIEDMGTAQPDEPCIVDWISGACMLMRREALEDFGLLDESFFLYYEETDWCLRAREAGWEVRHVPTTSIVHVGGQSVAVSGKATLSGLSLGFYQDSRRIYFKKHFGTHASWAIEAIHGARKAVRAAKSFAGMPVGAW